MDKKTAADLHTHSTASDGDLSPAEIVTQAKKIGLKAVALTDHDTLKGLKEALQTGDEIGIKVICGAELSIAFHRPYFIGSLHCLLYFPEYLIDDPDFNSAIAQILSKGRGENLIIKRIEYINSFFGPKGDIEKILKKPLTIEEIKEEGDNITRRHFALALSKNHGLEKDEITRLIGNDSPAYVPSGIEIEMLKPLLEKFKVVSSLAHPAAGSYPPPSVYREVLPPVETVKKILPEFLELGLNGLEIYYPGHTKEHIEELKKWAIEYDLIATGGSDCHDADMRPMGTAGVGQKDLDILLSRL